MRISVGLLIFVGLVRSSDDDILTELSRELRKMLDSELTLPIQKRVSDELLQLVEGSGEVEGAGNSVSVVDVIPTEEKTVSVTEPPTTTIPVTTTTTTATTTTTTTTAATTTRRPSVSIQGKKGSQKTAKVCVEESQCLVDYDCGKGRCSGTHLGRCNCRACVPAHPCSTDSDCGGLTDACHEGACHCERALALHGFPLMVDALLSFCGVKQCSLNGDDCHGLPCNVGRCRCAGAN